MNFTFIKSTAFAFVVVSSGADALDQDVTSTSLCESASGEDSRGEGYDYDRSCTKGCIWAGRTRVRVSCFSCVLYRVAAYFTAYASHPNKSHRLFNCCTDRPADMRNCKEDCTAFAGSADMPNCSRKCTNGGNMKSCLSDCTAFAGSADMSKCSSKCTTFGFGSNMNSCDRDCFAYGGGTDQTGCMRNCQCFAANPKDCITNFEENGDSLRGSALS